MQQAHDFREECEVLNAVLEPLSGADFDRVTLFKGWTINDVMQHLYLGDIRATMTLTDPERYAGVKAERQAVVAASTADKIANQREAAGNLEFERAAGLRDQVKTLRERDLGLVDDV